MSDRRLRMFCFPYAGGSAATFSGWADRLPSWVDVRPVQPPGCYGPTARAPRSIDDMVDAASTLLAPMLDRPFAFFGHSLGALVAYETARAFTRRGWREPLHLYVSGRRAPQFPEAEVIAPDASDQDLIDYVAGLGGTPPDVLADTELIRMVLPTLRSHFAAIRTYQWRPGPPLTCSLTVLSGEDDEESAPEYVAGWQEHTTRPLETASFPGDHFFLHTSTAALLDRLGRALGHALASTAGASAAPVHWRQ